MAVTEEQRVEFAEEGVVMVKGGLKAWVDFLRQATEHQVGHPHLWSVLGRGGDCYGYMQRNVWMTNDAFYDFSRLSPLGHILAQLGGCEEVRLTTDMLLVNPKQDLCWHQDNQNGPIEINSALRWWVALDDCGERGAPEFLKGSQRNGSVADSATSVDIDGGDLPRFAARRTAFMPEAGDLIIWDSRTIHRLLAPEKATLRRAHSGTAARAGALYVKRGAASAMTDLAEHGLREREPLAGACFPRIYPSPLPQEEGPRERHELVSRSPWRVLESLQPLLQRAANLETNRAEAREKPAGWAL